MPGETETLLLKAAGLSEAEPALLAWRGFRERVGEGKESLVERRLLPLALRNLLKLGCPRDSYLVKAYAESFSSNAALLNEAGPALEALHHARIPTMVLKGTALLLAHYRDLGARPMSDVDILVPEARVGEALDVLQAAGWRGDTSRRWLKSEAHADPLISPGGAYVDLHRYATCEARFSAANNEFFANSRPIEVSGARTSVMEPGDQLLHTIAHGLRWSIAPSSIWVIDALTVLRGGGVEVSRTVEQAARLRLGVPLRGGLQLVRQIYGNHEVLDALIAALRTCPAPVLERVEDWFRVREPRGVLGALPNLWFAYRRSALGGSVSPSGFPGFLSEVWRLEPGQSLFGLLIRKAGRRLSQAR